VEGVHGKCKTCGREKGHIPEAYVTRMEELRRLDSHYYEDEGTWSEWCGFYAGILILFIVLVVFVWAVYADQDVGDLDEL